MKKSDLAINYSAKLKEAKSNIEKLSELNVNLSKITRRVNSIERETRKQVKNSDDLDSIYSSSINQLEQLNQNLKDEYEIYYKIDFLYRDLSEKINGADESSIDEVISISNTLLDSLRTSTTIDFDEEKDLVNNVYEVIYIAIKLELMYSDKKRLLNRVRDDSIDTVYIVESIKKDIKDLDGNKKDINEILSEIEKQGLDDSYLLNEDLITAIFLRSFRSKKTEDFLDSSVEQEKRYDKLERLSQRCNESLEEIEKFEIKKRSFKKRAIKRKFAVAINTMLLGAALAGGIYATKDLFNDRQYLTTTTVYDTSKDEPEVTEEYLEKSKDSISLVEYSPWDNPGYFRDKYTRNVYTYNISNDDKYKNISEYLTEDFNGKIEYTQTRESVDEMPEDYGYSENKYVITKVEKDSNNYQDIYNPMNRWATSLLAAFFVSGIELYIFNELLSKDNMELINKDREAYIKDLEKLKENLKELERQKSELYNQIEESSKTLLEDYYLLPLPLMKTKEVQQAKEKINQYTKYSNL